MKRSRLRPARPLAPIGIAVAVLATWWLVAHNGGAGWVQVLGDIVFGILLIGTAGPAVVLARARLRLAAAPSDANAGMPVAVEIDASTRLRIRPVAPPGPEAFIGPVRGRLRGRPEPRPRRRDATAGNDPLTLVPSRRGVVEALVLDVATAAPFGLQWWTRRVVVLLPAPLHVAPRRGEPIHLRGVLSDESGPTRQRAPADSGEPRGVRPYRPGDNRRHVHWPATAHAGSLMVREMEEAASGPVTVTVNLPSDPAEAERMAEGALGTVLRLLDLGAGVALATWERSGPVVGPVADRRGAGRRLARAVDGPGGDGTGIALSR